MATRDTIHAGVGLFVAVVFAVMAQAAVTDYQSTQTLQIDNETEWTDYQGTATDTEVTADGTVALADTATSGTWESTTIAETADRLEVVTIKDSPEVQSANLTVDGSTYELDDGVTKVDVSDGLTDYTFTLELSRNQTSDASPEVDTYTSYTVSDSMLGMIMQAGFALLLLLGLVYTLAPKLEERGYL